jgi:hypothetical protein
MRLDMHHDLPSAPHPIVAHAKFFSRSGSKFFFKGMRLPDVGGTLDLYEKLKLRERLEELKAARTTGLILTETQSQPLLDLVAAAGMVAIVELTVTAAELLDTARFGTAISRIAHTANIYRSHKGLCGYLIDSPSSNSKTIHDCLGVLLRTLKEHDEDALVAIEHRENSGLIAFADEDFLYGVVGCRSTSQIPDLVASLHERAGTRPVVVEFAEAWPDQDTSLAIAFGAGAAGKLRLQCPLRLHMIGWDSGCCDRGKRCHSWSSTVRARHRRKRRPWFRSWFGGATRSIRPRDAWNR